MSFFAEEYSAGKILEDTEELVQNENICGFNLSICLPQDDFNFAKKTLFATMIWSGSRVLCQFLFDNQEVIRDKNIIEFGAAVGLPSMLARKLGSKKVCASDFKSDSVLQALSCNIQRNFSGDKSIFCVGHVWGEDVSDLLKPLESEREYDVALAAECLWKHECHPSLVRSLQMTLKIGGVVFMTFSHHIPGLEYQDLAFFELAEMSGFKIKSKFSRSAPHMWNDRTIEMHVVELEKVQSISI